MTEVIGVRFRPAPTQIDVTAYGMMNELKNWNLEV